MIRSLILGICLIVSTSCARLRPHAEDPCGFRLSSPGKWRILQKTTPVIVRINKTVPVSKELLEVLDAVVSEYNSAAGRTIILIGQVGVEGNVEDTYDLMPSVYFLSSDNNYLAVTHLRLAGSTIYDADVVINTRYDYIFSENLPAPNQYDLHSILVHEFGHLLGLVHSADYTSPMYPSIASGVMHRSLTTQDRKNIQCAYGTP